MDFRISKRYFYNALSAVARAISVNSPLPSLSGIKIEVLEDENILKVSNYFDYESLLLKFKENQE